MEPLLVCLIIICLPTFLTGRNKHLSVKSYHILFNKELFFEAQVEVFCILFVEYVFFSLTILHLHTVVVTLLPFLDIKIPNVYFTLLYHAFYTTGIC